MQLQISLHGIGPSNAVQELIREKAAKLEHVYDRITRCRVVLELDGAARARQFRARIHLAVPGSEIVVTHEHNREVHIALREAFADARRQLEDYVRSALR